MVTIGIVGALSPLGIIAVKKLSGKIEASVVWKVDEHLGNDEEAMEFKSVKDALIATCPDYILDLDYSDVDVMQKIELYNSYNVSALIGGVKLNDADLEKIRNMRHRENHTLVIIPNFSASFLEFLHGVSKSVLSLKEQGISFKITLMDTTDVAVPTLLPETVLFIKKINKLMNVDISNNDWIKTKRQIGCVEICKKHVAKTGYAAIGVNVDYSSGSLISSVSCSGNMSQMSGIIKTIKWLQNVYPNLPNKKYIYYDNLAEIVDSLS